MKYCIFFDVTYTIRLSIIFDCFDFLNFGKEIQSFKVSDGLLQHIPWLKIAD